ncbi:hypothetical protein [Micropruina sp.]|uniref:hypothetical protein n=1 Tax=Micropruina sp. TaxID=2737536 RepID=UPI0039E64BCC
MSAREVDRSDDSAATSTRRKAPPSRMRNYRIVAEPRTDPDLHKLAQLFIGMAFARADAEREAQRNSGRHEARSSQPPTPAD